MKWELRTRVLNPELVEICRRNLEGAKTSKLPPPTEKTPCEYCGVLMEPVLFKPEGPWTSYCVMGCHWCEDGCRKVHRYDEKCPKGYEDWEWQ